MGGCASKPNDFDTVSNQEPAPVEAPPSPIAGTPEEAKAEAVAPQEIKDEEETKVVTLVEASEPAPEIEAKPKEATAETKAAAHEADKPSEAKAEAEETPKEEKKEVAETVATTVSKI